MHRRNQIAPLIAAASGMVLLILDSQCAADSAGQAISLCLRSVIPNLFPMFVLSGLLVSICSGSSGKILAVLEKSLGLPSGGGCLFLLGTVGGFPVGAQCIAQAVGNGSLSRKNGEQMLGFCNNCSPAFLFGVAGCLFESPFAPLLIFLIQLESALLVASFTGFHNAQPIMREHRTLSLPEAVTGAVRSMASVCSWVVLAGVVAGFLDRWLFPLFPAPLPHLIRGLLEITGGVLGLETIIDSRLRFLLCTGFVCFGGISVLMQIRALCEKQGLSIGYCIRQKAVQCLIGWILAGGVLGLGPWMMAIIPIFLVFRKNVLEKPSPTMYNSSHKGGLDYVVPEKN